MTLTILTYYHALKRKYGKDIGNVTNTCSIGDDMFLSTEFSIKN